MGVGDGGRTGVGRQSGVGCYQVKNLEKGSKFAKKLQKLSDRSQHICESFLIIIRLVAKVHKNLKEMNHNSQNFPALRAGFGRFPAANVLTAGFCPVILKPYVVWLGWEKG